MSLIIGVFAFSAVGCDMIAKTPEGIAKSVVAKVNGDEITRGDLDKEVDHSGLIAQIEQQYGTDYTKNEEAMAALKEQKGKLLDNMITVQLFLQKAKELKLVPSDSEMNKEVDAQYKKIKSGYKTDAEWKSALSQAKYTEDELRESIKKNVIEQKVESYIFKDMKISDEKAKAYYDQNQTKYTEKPDTMRLSHILVGTEDDAKKVEQRIKNGEDFAKIAKEVSTDGTKDKGGDLGEVQVGDQNYDQTFMAAAEKLKDGEISAPVHSQFGWHVIKCVKRTNYPVKAFDKVKADIKATLLSQEQQTKLQSTIDKWKKAATIKKYDKNLM